MLMVNRDIKSARKRMKRAERNANRAARIDSKSKRNELKNFRKQKRLQKKAEIKAQKVAVESAKLAVANTKNAVYGREKRGIRGFLKRQNISGKVFSGLIINFVFAIFELIGGLFSGSAAIISDAIHDFGDALSLGFAIYFGKKSKHGPDKNYTYGYSRFSILGVFVTTVVLVVGAAFMIYVSILKLIIPTDIDVKLMIILSVIGLLINTIAAFRTADGRFNIVKAISKGTVNEIVLEDVIGWIVVLAGSVVMLVTNWNWLDPIMSIVISVYLMISSISSFKKVLELFLEKVPNGISVDIVKYQVLAIPHVKKVHHLHLWSMDGTKMYATMHVVVDGKIVDGVFIENSVPNRFNIKQEIRKQLKSTGISDVTIELEDEGEK